MPIIAASLGAIITGIVLLHIHHSRVKQEIDLQRKKELFEKKQKAYRSILRQVNSLLDFSAYLGPNPNWRITRDIYNQLILVASRPVLESYFDSIKRMNELDDTKLADALKSLLRTIREDLYGEKIEDDQIKMHNPPTNTMRALEIYGKQPEKLKQLGLESYDSLASMDIAAVNKSTGIPLEELGFLKAISEKEASFIKEFKQFIIEQGI